MFFRKNLTHQTSLFTESKLPPKVYDIFTTDPDVIKLDETFHLLTLSSNYLISIAKNNLIIINSLNLKEISSTPLEIESQEEIINFIESTKNQLQIITCNKENKLRILFYNVEYPEKPTLTKEANIALPHQPDFIFYVNDVYLICFKDDIEIRNNNFSLLQSFRFTHKTLCGIAPISDTQFLFNMSDSIYLCTRDNNIYTHKKLFAHENCTIKSMIYKDGKVIYIAENIHAHYVNVFINDLQTNSAQLIPHANAQQIFSINIMNNVLAMHLKYRHSLAFLGDAVELWDINTAEKIDSLALKKTFKGYISLTPNMSILCCDIIDNKLEMLDFAKLYAYRTKLDMLMHTAQPNLIQGLRETIIDYAIDINFFNSIHKVIKHDDSLTSHKAKMRKLTN